MRQVLDIKRLNSKTIYFVITGLFFIFIVTFFTLFISANPVSSLTYLLAFLLFSICSIPILIHVRIKTFDLLEPIYIVLVLYFLYFGIRTVFILLSPPYISTAPNLDTVSDMNIINLALLYTIVGIIFMIIGYYSRLPAVICKVIPRIKFIWNERKAIKRIYILYFIGLFIRLFIIQQGLLVRFGVRKVPVVLVNIMQIFAQIPLYAYALYAVYFFSVKGRRPSIILGLIILFSEVGFAFMSGWKGNFIILMFILLIAYHYGLHKIRIRSVLIPLIVVLLIVFPLVNTYRYIYPILVQKENVSILNVRGFFRVTAAVLERMKEYSLMEYIAFSFGGFINRFAGIDSLSVTIKRTPEAMNFQYGRTISWLFLWPIPRVIFPNKPNLSFGGVFGVKYWGWPEEPWHGSAAITQIGEFYLNFHLIGIILGMFLSGIIYRLAYLYFIKKGIVDKRISVFLYSFAFVHLLRIESNIAMAYAGLLQAVLFGLVIAWFLNVRIRWR